MIQSEDSKISTSIEHLDVILNDIQLLIDNRLDFNAFITIVLGIEYLGNFSDEKDFDEFKQSEIRFKNGLDHFKTDWYKKNKSLLFSELRGPLIHQYRPGKMIILTSKCKNNAPLADHLKRYNEADIIFVLERFYEDFKEAVSRFKNKIKMDSGLNKEKLNARYSTVTHISSPTNEQSYLTTGFTEYQSALLVNEGKNRKEKRRITKDKNKKE